MRNKSAISLGSFSQAVSHAVSEANRRLLEEHLHAMEQMEYPVPLQPPLCISRMKVTFSAHVSRSERSSRGEDGEKLQLDFQKGQANFHGEMEFSPLPQLRAEDVPPPVQPHGEMRPQGGEPPQPPAPTEDQMLFAPQPPDTGSGSAKAAVRPIER